MASTSAGLSEGVDETNGGGDGGRPTEKKGAGRGACLVCRGMKMKCVDRPDAPDGSCVRCHRLNQDTECVRPAVRLLGRQKGAKNKVSSVDKALQVLEREVKRRKLEGGLDAEEALALLRSTTGGKVGSSPERETDGSAVPESTTQPVFQLPSMFSELSASRSVAPLGTFPPLVFADSIAAPTPFASTSALPVQPLPYAPSQTSSGNSPAYAQYRTRQLGTTAAISNPLGLLAEASDAAIINGPTPSQQASPADLFHPPSLDPAGSAIAQMLRGSIDPRLACLNLDQGALAQGLVALTAETFPASIDPPKNLFKLGCSTTKRDLDVDLDPISLALVTEEEVHAFFNVFFTNLQPVISILDPALHTPAFVRKRSLFLLTVVAANGACYTHGAGPAFRRLHLHAERLAKEVVRQNSRSTEIVQAMLLWVPWLPPSENVEVENRFVHRTTMQAISMATELGMDRPIPAPKLGDTLDPILDADLQEIDRSNIQLVTRIVRNRERLWLRAFVWEASLAVAGGRPSSFIRNELIQNDTWYQHPLAIAYDREICGLASLRITLIKISEDFKYRLRDRGVHEGVEQVRSRRIDALLDPWKERWTKVLDSDDNHTRCRKLYLGMIGRHGRLWLLSHGLHAKVEVEEEAQQVANDCLVAALESCYAAVADLKNHKFFSYLPNPVPPMLAYCCVLAMRLYEPEGDDLASLATFLGLLANLAVLLEGVGMTPSHRIGAAAMYGRRLKVIVRLKILQTWQVYNERKAGTTSEPISTGQNGVSSLVGTPAGFDFGGWSDVDWFAAGQAGGGGMSLTEEIDSLLLSYWPRDLQLSNDGNMPMAFSLL